MKTIKVSDEFHQFLTQQAINKGETYEQILKRLLQKSWNVKFEAEAKQTSPATQP